MTKPQLDGNSGMSIIQLYYYPTIHMLTCAYTHQRMTNKHLNPKPILLVPAWQTAH
jgi:hypothetical protein